MRSYIIVIVVDVVALLLLVSLVINSGNSCESTGGRSNHLILPTLNFLDSALGQRGGRGGERARRGVHCIAVDH